MPKIHNLRTDIKERKVDVAFLQEIWEQSDNSDHNQEIEEMLELDGLQYVSKPRPKNHKGTSYGGVAIVVDNENFSCKKIDNVPLQSKLEIIWCLIKPKDPSARFKNIIACSFYSAPGKGKNTQLADHIISSLHLLSSRYPDCAIILGADRNSMDISPILNCGLKIRLMVDIRTRGAKTLDIILMNTANYYNSALVVPPINPDNPLKAKPSDHSVPVCIPHTDRHKPPIRHYRIITYRPLPRSSIVKFGEWITHESWDCMEDVSDTTEQVSLFENLLSEKMNSFFPEKTMKIGCHDKPFITAELKRLHRQKSREYCKRGKSAKYHDLKKRFDELYKHEAQSYLDKTVNDLRDTNPGKMYSILKRLGSKPGEVSQENNFTLPSHAELGLSSEESAELIAQHFASISQEFRPLCISNLPPRVQEKLLSPELPPTLDDHEIFQQIKAAKKPKSGVQNDLPRKIVQEFSPELAKPVSKIINSILASGKWPHQWKLEQVIPIAKIPQPLSEDDLRPISLTPFFSKVTEHFVVNWLLHYIEHKIDFRQYGGQKGNSINHYLIELVNFVLYNQDSSEQVAVLACLVDFKKAFNRQSHEILITKLSDLGVPGWLLKLVVAFLEDRRMVVKYDGKSSTEKSLPGGGPQGTILALLLFLVLINDLGFSGQSNNAGETITSVKRTKLDGEIHLKYVDDFALAETVNMKTKLSSDTSQPKPSAFHCRTGHILSSENSRVFKQLLNTKEYADSNLMQINYKKTNLMVFNPCTSKDFLPKFVIDNHILEVVEETRLLGLTVRSDLKWSSNTKNIVNSAYRRLWVIKRLKNLGACLSDLVDIYIKQVRSLVEFGVPVW